MYKPETHQTQSSSTMSNFKICLLVFLIHLPSLITSAGGGSPATHYKSLILLRKSLSRSGKFLSLLDNFIGSLSRSDHITLHALQDCRELAESNIDFLQSSVEILSTYQQINENILSRSQAEKVHTLLSAVLTNQQTCLDGLQAPGLSEAWRGKNGTLLVQLFDNTKLYSAALSFFVENIISRRKNVVTTWQPRKKLILPARIRAIYESKSSKKLEYDGDDDEEIVINDMVTVNKDGDGDFTTINEAISMAPDHKKSNSSRGYFLIYISPGVYEEYITIGKKKKNLMMVGYGINRTVITGNHSHCQGWSTFKSATFAVTASNFLAMYITFRNTAGAVNRQAVALRSGADMSAFYSCSFEAYQDTLYTHSHRQFYTDCDIYGTVDFIFGNAAVVIQNCRIHARLPHGHVNTITAQNRATPDQNTGISIQNCTIQAAPDLASSNRTVYTYLGRPWKVYARTVFMQSFMGELIDPAGWFKWNGNNSVSDLFYAEYGNSGPGADTSQRVDWLGYHKINGSVAANFTVCEFIDGDDWLPQTGVPFVDGLLPSNCSFIDCD